MSDTPAGTAGFSLIDIVIAILRYRRIVIIVAAITAIATAAFALSRPRTYTSHATFTPQSTRPSIGALGGLAAQFGVAVPAADGNQSPAFYADVLHTRTILGPLAQLPVPLSADGRSDVRRYVDLVTPADALPNARLASAIALLERAMVVNTDARTGIVTVRTVTTNPRMSAVLTDSAIGFLNRFNVETRRSQAAAQSAFLQARYDVTLRELREAENELVEFSRRNRTANTPDLIVQRERLARMVGFREQVYSGVAQALEQAKLDQIRDTPLITVIEAADFPIRPDSRGVLSKALAALVVGGFLGAIIAVVRHGFTTGARDRPDKFAEVEAELAALRRLKAR